MGGPCKGIVPVSSGQADATLVTNTACEIISVLRASFVLPNIYALLDWDAAFY